MHLIHIKFNPEIFSIFKLPNFSQNPKHIFKFGTEKSYIPEFWLSINQKLSIRTISPKAIVKHPMKNP
jgi:hypothetical protein